MPLTPEIDPHCHVDVSSVVLPLRLHAVPPWLSVNLARALCPILSILPRHIAITDILDNGLVFGAKVFVSVVRRYRLEQEYITPYSPEQNGMIERFFLTLKQECVWLQRFEDRDHAFRVIADWLDRYHAERPHSALGYLTPNEYRGRLAA